MMPGPLLEDLLGRVAGCFPRRETRQCCGQMVSGLLMELEDHNCWTIAEAAGHRGPHWMQHLLSRAVWDEQQVLDIASAWALRRARCPHPSGTAGRAPSEPSLNRGLDLLYTPLLRVIVGGDEDIALPAAAEVLRDGKSLRSVPMARGWLADVAGGSVAANTSMSATPHPEQVSVGTGVAWPHDGQKINRECTLAAVHIPTKWLYSIRSLYRALTAALCSAERMNAFASCSVFQNATR